MKVIEAAMNDQFLITVLLYFQKSVQIGGRSAHLHHGLPPQGCSISET